MCSNIVEHITNMQDNKQDNTENNNIGQQNKTTQNTTQEKIHTRCKIEKKTEIESGYNRKK